MKPLVRLAFSRTELSDVPDGATVMNLPKNYVNRRPMGLTDISQAEGATAIHDHADALTLGSPSKESALCQSSTFVSADCLNGVFD